MPTSVSCRDSSATCAARDARCSPLPIDGPLYKPIFSGSATIADGRIRHFSLPNSLDAINGTIRFDPTGIRLDDVAATMGGGRVQFGGRIGFDGYLPGDLNVSVRGEDMHLRYPEGIRSTVDADLVVSGNVQALALSGLVTVKSAIWNSRVDPNAGFLDFGRSGSSTVDVAPAPAAPTVPLRFDVEVRIPSTLRVENNLARLVASADLQLRGTYDRPLLFGRAEVDRGEVIFQDRRYLVTRGQHRLHEPDADRALSRRRSRNARAGSWTDVSGDGARAGHDDSPAARAELRSAVAGGRRPGPALQRRAAHHRARRRGTAGSPTREPQRPGVRPDSNPGHAVDCRTGLGTKSGGSSNRHSASTPSR